MTHHGGRIHWIVGADEAGGRVDAWLASRAEVRSRSRAREWIERGKVFLNGREVSFADAGTRLRSGDEVVLWVDRPGSSRPLPREVVARRSSLHVVFEDDAVLVLDKPPGLLVEPLPGDRSEVTLRELAADRVRAAAGGQALVVHRIDRDTSGLVVFAKDEASQVALKRQFERRTAERVYLAVATGRFRDRDGTWTDPLVWDKVRLVQRRARPDERGPTVKEAVASYRVLEQFADAALIEVRLGTGKRNQIRAQARLHGHALVGERIYAGAGQPAADVAPSFPRQALHAARLVFRHPATGRRVEFTSPLPADLQRLIQSFRRAR